MGGRYIFILLLIFLVACQPYIQAVPTSEHQTLVEPVTEQQNVTDACAATSCPSGQDCQDGKCVCPSSQKMCKNECIAANKCCTDKDCGSGICDEGTCAKAPDCRYGEILKNGKCQCAADKTFCREQDKCISKDDCCVHSQCDRFERCVESGWRVSLCAKAEEKKICKIIADRGRTEQFEIKGIQFNVKPNNWLNDGSIEINVSNGVNETLRLAENVTTTYSNVTLFQEGIEVTGGFCKEDEDE